MRKYTKMIAGLFCAIVLATSAFAADTAVKAGGAVQTTTAPAESWVLTLGGVGNTATGDATTAFGVDLSIGRTGHLLLPLEAGLRQSVSYSDNSTTFNTRLYSDWTVLTYKKLDVFAGGAVGLQYGNQKPSWEIAPEAGVRYWLKKDVAILARAEVPWDMGQWEFKDTVRYFLGLSVKF